VLIKTNPDYRLLKHCLHYDIKIYNILECLYHRDYVSRERSLPSIKMPVT